MSTEIKPKGNWYGRLAQAAFWFFLIKGLLWLSLPFAIWFGWRIGASG